jgi:hypothetical protein
MASLGNLGVAKPKVSDSFGWFGHEIHIHPDLTDLVLMDFAEQAQGLDENSPEVMGFLKKQIRLIIAPESFDAFWQAALDNGQDSMDLMTVMKTIIESTAKRPTALPSDSSDGQPRTVTTSPDVSSLPDTAGFQETLDHTRAKLAGFRDAAYAEQSPLTAMDRRVIEAEAGRPDVGLFIVDAARQRAAG